MRLLTLALLWLLSASGEVCASNASSTTLRIGFLMSFSHGIGKIIAGAIPLAVETINRDDTILPMHTVEFIVGDCGQPDSYVGIQKMTEMKRTGIHAFIGPDESCASEALVAAAWNKPLISYKCIDQNLSDKKKYPTFARTLPPSSKISKSVISLLKHYEWNKVVLIVSKNPANKQMEESLWKLASEQNIVISSTFYLPGQYISRYESEIEEIIEKSHTKTRVYILLTETVALVDFVRCMGEKALLDTGNYVIISVEEEVFYSVRKEVYESEQYHTLRLYDLRAVLIVTGSPPSNPDYAEFRLEVNRRNRKEPFNVPFHPRIPFQVPIYAGLAYDAVIILAQAFHRVIQNGFQIDQGLQVIEALKNMTYKSILGFSVRIDQNGEAEGNYTLLAMQVINSSIDMQIVGVFQQTDNDVPILDLTRTLHFYGDGPPKSEPKCGFYNEHCDSGMSPQMIGTLAMLAIISSVCAFFIFKHYHYEYKLNKSAYWMIDLKDLVIINTNSEYALQNIRNTINIQGLKRMSVFTNHTTTNKSDSLNCSLVDLFENRNYGIGVYKGSVVFMKRLHKKVFDLTRNMRKELIQVRELRHENINSVIGVCLDAPNVSILFVYCARGSLEDVIKNKDLDLDNMFVASLVADLIKGMIYLHDSEIVSHGNLKPSNCLIDSRWVLQITDYGLHEFKAEQELRHKDMFERNLLWKAPELLRNLNAADRGSQKGDVYSFALILFEIISRRNPFEDINLSSEDILHRIINPQLHMGQIFRPNSKQLNCAAYICKCIEECWKEEAEDRPDFRFINIRLREMQAGLKPNIFDNMITILEKYSYNLESLVQERTKQLLEEKKKTENLLLRMLPKTAAEQLKRGAPVEAEYFDSVTIYFSDIVGFTELSAISTPIQVVNLLNDLYTCFDSIIGNYEVYKVETIGDAYMVVSGLPIRNSDKHAGEIASMALHLLKEICNFTIAHRPGESLKLRIGIHSGPCVAGVVGLKMPRYCLFGDTVNVASRMESTGEAHRIHVSYCCKQILDKLGGYQLEERGLVPIKGKGQMKTYWLIAKDNYVQATFVNA